MKNTLNDRDYQSESTRVKSNISPKEINNNKTVFTKVKPNCHIISHAIKKHTGEISTLSYQRKYNTVINQETHKESTRVKVSCLGFFTVAQC